MKRKRSITVTTGRAPRALSKAIQTCLALGPGSMTRFNVDGKIKFKKITWKNSCTIKVGQGLICDGRRRCNIPFGSYWGAHTMNATMVFNNVDPVRFRQYQKAAVKQREAKKSKKKKRKKSKKSNK